MEKTITENITAPDDAIFYLDDGKGFVSLVEYNGNDLSPVNAARASFGKRKTEFDEKDSKLLKFLIENDHSSPLEMTYLQFLIKAPLYISTQHLRHRISSFNFTSYRYTELKEEMDFYTPKDWRKQSKSNKQGSSEEIVNLEEVINSIYDSSNLKSALEENLKQTYHLYKTLLVSGVSRELARGILPQCTYTTYYWGCNLRSFLHFLDLRDKPDAQLEIQKLAKAMKKLVKPIFPETFKHWSKAKKSLNKEL